MIALAAVFIAGMATAFAAVIGWCLLWERHRAEKVEKSLQASIEQLVLTEREITRQITRLSDADGRQLHHISQLYNLWSEQQGQVLPVGKMEGFVVSGPRTPQ